MASTHVKGIPTAAKPNTDEEYERELRQVKSAAARQLAAQARNARVRMQNAEGMMKSESMKLDALMRQLSQRHGISYKQIGRLVGLSDTRVKQRLMGLKR